MVPTLQVVYNLLLKLDRNKQDNSVINCTLLALLKKIKGKKVQSSDSLVGQNGGLLLAPSTPRTAGGKRRTAAEVSTDRYSADSRFLLSLSAGMLALGHDTQASYAAVTTAARLQLLLCACLPLHVCSSVHTCVCHSRVSFVCTKSALYTIQRVVC